MSKKILHGVVDGDGMVVVVRLVEGVVVVVVLGVVVTGVVVVAEVGVGVVPGKTKQPRMSKVKS